MLIMRGSPAEKREPSVVPNRLTAEIKRGAEGTGTRGDSRDAVKVKFLKNYLLSAIGLAPNRGGYSPRCGPPERWAYSRLPLRSARAVLEPWYFRLLHEDHLIL